MTINDDDGRIAISITSKGETRETVLDLFEAYDSLRECEKVAQGQPREVWFTMLREWASKSLGLDAVTLKTAFTIRQNLLDRVKSLGKEASGTPS